MRGWSFVILIAVAMVPVLAVALPVADLFLQQSDETARLKEDYANYRASIAAQPALKMERANLDRQESAAAALLHGDSAALAAANMQSLVKLLVERHGGHLRSAQNLSTAISGGMEKIEAAYELTIPAGSLKAVTYELETGSPYLFLDGVAIRGEQLADGAPHDLHVSWTVHGYRWAGMP
ncbi:MAG TPA: type II secretion system protein GspM [Rhizomicrobium sp.]|jgi:general secretion pathway protein M